MHATQVAHAFHTKRWVYEEKYDGWRMSALMDTGHVRLVSRNGRNHTKRFSHIVAAVASLKPTSLILDGEVAVFDQEFVPDSNGSATTTTATWLRPRCSWHSTCSNSARRTAGANANP